ncbi:MAG TPA: LysR family transcriptional regulator [Opitutales bacterium]|nr:LysR family transcriptional regulator [Opitutales bacterium]HOO92010.1 LysR family transcriptional regulator [Opitutales bacterium]
MHIENFKIFADLVQSKSFSQAAKINGITQSAVSQQLRAMENHFKVLIVDRSQKQFKLTNEGKRLHESAKEILNLYERLDCELQEMKKVISGNIRVATIYSVGLHELPPYMKRFLSTYPTVNVHLEYRRSNLVYEDVLHNIVDLGIVAYPTKNRELEYLPFLEDELVLIASPDHPLAKKDVVDLKELPEHAYIGFDNDIPTRKATDQIFRDARINILPVMEFDNIETVKRAVEINAGVAIIPRSTVTQEVEKGLLVAMNFKGKRFLRPVFIIHRKGRILTPAMEKFIGLLTSKEEIPSNSEA